MATLAANHLDLGYRRGALVVHDLVLNVDQGEIYASGDPDAVMTGDVLREVFRVEGVIAHDPHTKTPVFTPLQSVRVNGHSADGPEQAY